MCIIMVTEGAEIPLDHLANGWANNPDGGGFMFIDHEGAVQVRKGLMSFDEWIDEYDRAWERYGDSSPFVVHFRIGTHGPNDEANTHPHVVNSRLAMVHNGIISGLSYKKKDSRSDTRVFIDNTIRLLPRRWLDNPAIFELVEDRIGSTNKLVFLSTDTHERLYILNEYRGVWDQGVWYSNSTYKRNGWVQVRDWDDWSGRPIGTGIGTQSVKAGANTGSGELIKPPFGIEPVSNPGDPSDRGYYIDCICGEGIDVTNEPWCWQCLWCVICDAPAESGCECDHYKQLIDWDEWGDEYMDRWYDDQERATRQRLMEMTDEEVERVTS